MLSSASEIAPGVKAYLEDGTPRPRQEAHGSHPLGGVDPEWLCQVQQEEGDY